MRRITRHLVRRIGGRLRSDERGFVVVWFALFSVVIMGMAAMSIDVGLAYYTRTRLSQALDSAALAMGAAPWGTSQDQLKQIGQNYLNQNFGNDPATGNPVSLQASFSQDQNTISLSAAVAVPSSFAQVLGVAKFPVGTSSEVKRQTQGLELSMVLDNTGSMWSNNNIQAVRDSAGLMVDILFGGSDVHPNLKIGIVPYSVAVNVAPVANQVVTKFDHPLDTSSINTKNWKGCVIERTPPNDVQDTSTAAGGYWTQYWWPSSKDNNWSNSDIDNNTQKLQNDVHGPNIGCPTPVTPLTNVKQTLKTAINAMTAWNRGGTMSNVGMAWGLRMLSPEPPFAEGAAWDDSAWKKAVVLMTDGDNLLFKLTNTNKNNINQEDKSVSSDWSAYGRIESSFAQSVFKTTNLSTVKTMLDSKLTAVCQAMKAKNIIVYTVVFTSGISAQTKQIYRDCASDPGKFFDAPSQDDLKASFNSIANELSRLRISR